MDGQEGSTATTRLQMSPVLEVLIAVVWLMPSNAAYRELVC